jgi:rubrerythrin
MDRPDSGLLQRALALELQAVARYERHSAGTEDPRFVVYWESLRRNEAQHRDELRRLLLAAGSRPTEAADDFEPADGVLDTAAAEPVRGFGSATSALRADLVLERRAVKVYGRSAAEARDPAVKALFRELARGEAGHARGLRTLLRALEEPGFPVLLFCPLCGWQLDAGPAPLEGRAISCSMCPGRFSLVLRSGDWALERLPGRD